MVSQYLSSMAYDPETVERIATEYALTSKSLKTICDEREEFPTYQTLLCWKRDHVYVYEVLAQAKNTRIDAFDDDILAIADDDTLDPADRRIRTDNRRWLLSKLRHKTFGDKLDVTSGGEALAAPSHQIDARVQSIIMQAKQRQLAMLDDLDDEARDLLA